MKPEPGELCEHCRAGAPHHTVGTEAISGADRLVIWDIHEVDDTGGVGLIECTAAHLFDRRLCGSTWAD